MSFFDSSPKSPWWFRALVDLAIFPMFSFPVMLGALPSGYTFMQVMLWLYPVVIVASAWYARISYRERNTLAWIMLIFMWLIDASMWYLFFSGNNIGEIM